jgi:hypothetical protein
MEFILAGVNLSNSNPILSEDKTKLTWSMSVVTHIVGAPTDKFQQVDNTTFETGVEINAANIEAIAAVKAQEYVKETYPNT